MIEGRLLPHTIDVITAGSVDDGYGNARADWSPGAAVERTVAAYVRPASTSVRPAGNEHVEAGRNVVEVAWQVHTNDLDITALNRIRFGGVVYDVDGQPLTWRVLPGGKVGHSKLLLRRVDG